MISNCGHDENNRYSGGKAGDQTGTEWRVINWYNRPWKCVLRHPDAKVRKMIASMAKAAAVNNKIGYDQSERYTFWEHLKASNYDPAQITIACEADCSSGVAAIVKGAGSLPLRKCGLKLFIWFFVLVPVPLQYPWIFCIYLNRDVWNVRLCFESQH